MCYKPKNVTNWLARGMAMIPVVASEAEHLLSKNIVRFGRDFRDY